MSPLLRREKWAVMMSKGAKIKIGTEDQSESWCLPKLVLFCILQRARGLVARELGVGIPTSNQDTVCLSLLSILGILGTAGRRCWREAPGKPL
jgi:hypothetical protein